MNLKPQSRGKLLVMQKAPPNQVTQEDLLELILYSNQSCEARKNYKEKKRAIEAALRSGATVQHGVFTARIVQRSGKIHRYETLEVR